MQVSFSILFLGFILADCCWWWWADRQFLRLGEKGRVWRAGMALWALAMIGGLIFWVVGRSIIVVPVLPTLWSAIVYLWHLLVLPLLVMILSIKSLFNFVLERGINRKKTLRESVQAEMSPERRRLLKALLVSPSALAMTGSLVGLYQLQHFRVRREEIFLKNLPPELEGFQIAHVSDLHVGRLTHGKILKEVVEVTNSLKPDLIALTGDLVNDSLLVLPESIALVKALRARYGVYLCEGNHDLIENADRFRNSLWDADCKLLVNQATTLDVNGCPVRLIGTRWTGSLHVQQSAMTQDNPYARLLREEIQGMMWPNAFPIVLTHHPHAWEAAREAGARLTLSGHTHGGQLMLDHKRGLGPLAFRYWSGLYQESQQGRDSALFVSNGVGNWFPLRINAPAEIVHLTLRDQSHV